ncbi:MAG: nuclear transport factor 2 family protein [Bacteroidetes bacterium]|nr:nuclear transport factor 2 family protein [Bacteroidota bacterium]
MSKNIQLIKEAYSNFQKGNIPALLESLHDDINWIDPGYPDIPHNGKRKGKKEVMEFFTGMGNALTFDIFEPQLFIEGGNNVAVKGFFSGTANETGKRFESNWVMLWEIQNGKIISYENFFDTNNAVNSLK